MFVILFLLSIDYILIILIGVSKHNIIHGLIVSRLLLILASGSADVKKILFDSSVLEAQNFKLARLHPGTMASLICVHSTMLYIRRCINDQFQSFDCAVVLR